MSSSPAADPRSRRSAAAGAAGEPLAAGAAGDDDPISHTRRRGEPELGTVAGRYKLLSHVAEGGMGVVYRAEHVLSRKKLAIKILHPHLCHGRQAVERFRREVSAAAEIDHPGIVQVFDAGVDTDGSFYMAMELLEGESLGHRTRREWPGTRTAVDLILGMCEPLARAHEKGFVHRDLKPDNVFIARDHAGQETVKLLDFGLVREVTRRGPTMSGITFGTPEYMAPEQAMSAKRADVPADVWSVGVMLYELLAGRHPFTGETANAVMANAIKDPHPPLAEVAPHVPAELARVVERCLEKEPGRRPANAAALGSLLRELRERVELDERRPDEPVLCSHRDEEADGIGDEGSGGDADEHALLSPPPPLPPELRAGPSTDETPRSERGLTRHLGWVAIVLGAAGLLGVIAWALAQREGQMIATSLTGGAPDEAPVTRPEPEAVTDVVVEPGVSAPAVTERPSAASQAPREASEEPSAAPEATSADTPEADVSATAPVARTPRSVRPREGANGSALAEAQACLQRGDTRCAVSALQNGQSAAEMALLVDVYRMQGRTSEARSVMQRYVRRYPRGRESDEYRRALGLAGR